MDPVEHQVSVKLSRTAIHTIPFGLAVQRGGAYDEAEIYGGKTLIDAMEVSWTPQGTCTITVETGIVGNCNKIRVLTAFGTGLIAIKEVPSLDLSPNAAIGFLIKSDIAVAAGSLQFGWDKTNINMTTPVAYLNLPALQAGKWTFVSLAFTGTLADRTGVKSIGLRVAVDLSGATDAYLSVDEMRAGALSNGISGIVKNDEAKENDEAVQYDTILVLARGEMRTKLASGITCVAEQLLYPIIGTGEFTTTEILSGSPTVRASQDQATAGTGVRAIIG